LTAVLGDDLESIISSGKAEVGIVEKRKIGRPKNKITKKQCPFHLPENIVQAIDNIIAVSTSRSLLRRCSDTILMPTKLNIEPCSLSLSSYRNLKI
jgi:hypothetical protein